LMMSVVSVGRGAALYGIETPIPDCRLLVTLAYNRLRSGRPGVTRIIPSAFATGFAGTWFTRLPYDCPSSSTMSPALPTLLWHEEAVQLTSKTSFWMRSKVGVESVVCDDELEPPPEHPAKPSRMTAAPKNPRAAQGTPRP